MYAYIYGKIIDILTNYIIIETNNIGYNIFISNPKNYEIGKTYKIYLYEILKEEEHTLYGFQTQTQKDIFLKLISVKGLGPKMALSMFTNAKESDICTAINNEDIEYLKRFNKIGDKLAKQIIFDLKGKLITKDNKQNDLINALKQLGYKEKDYKYILNKISPSLPIEEQIKIALKQLK